MFVWSLTSQDTLLLFYLAIPDENCVKLERPKFSSVIFPQRDQSISGYNFLSEK